MSKFTTERLEYYAALPTQPEEGDGFFKKGIFMHEVRRMARQLLAYEQAAPAQPVIPEQAKPVAYTDNRNLKSLQKKGCATALLWLERNSEAGDIPLYTEVPAQPVSEPYKLISVKDDTPTESGDYWCYLGKDFENPIKYRVVYFDVRHHEFQDYRVTHWMHLPAEPAQEV
ncbi:hypothetical protein [Obesumbacterium proteus]|uniref:hypothetical protein n=1 Tax=Obesumbacterium proteus TaxID=82983 RepID=UPI00242EFA3E|nr:hypothetical protein [Obesumbacterium proteus]